MPQFIQLIYIVTIIIGAVCFSVQLMVVSKNLDVSNELVKNQRTGIFLAIILSFNICDFLILFFAEYVTANSTEIILIIENVLEIALAYALITMEAEYVKAKKSKWLKPAFTAMGSVVLCTDSAYESKLIEVSEDAYVILMSSLNLLPLIVAIYFCIIYMKKVMEVSQNNVVKIYLIIYNFVFVFLCVIVTLSLIDSRTQFNYIKYDKTIYVMFWFILNSMNAVFIWRSCRSKETDTESLYENSIEKKLDRIATAAGLTDREKQIAMLIYEGKTNDEIGEELFLSTNTVKVHTSNLYKKIGVNNRIAAIKKIREE